MLYTPLSNKHTVTQNTQLQFTADVTKRAQYADRIKALQGNGESLKQKARLSNVRGGD